MSYVQPPGNAANFSWEGAPLYVAPPGAEADFSWQESGSPVDTIVLVSGHVVATPPAPIGMVAAAGVVLDIADAAADIYSAAPVPAVSASGGAHQFIPYTTPPLSLVLACTPLYRPRHLDCPIHLDLWQPPCALGQSVEATGRVFAAAPPPSASLAVALRLAQSATGRVQTGVLTPGAAATAFAVLSLDLGDTSHTGAVVAHGALDVKTAMGASERIAQMTPTQTANRGSHAHGLLRTGDRRIAHADTNRLRRSIRASHVGMARTERGAVSGHKDAVRVQRPSRASHATLATAFRGVSAGHAEYLRSRNRQHIQQQQMLPAPALGLWLVVKQGDKMELRLLAGQQQAMWPLSGRWVPGYEPPGLVLALACDGNYHPRDLRCAVVLSPTGVQPPCIPDQPETGTIIVPIRRAYIVLNTITLVRASDGAPLSALSLSLNIDADSWTWGWDASIPGAELALVEPAPGGDPVELLATVNGQQFRLLAERIARDRRFAQSRIRISGRGRAAMLADPHSPIVTRSNAQARTMQQLLADALTINSVGIGWAVDWQAADWLVPAGLYSHTGSYIAHAQRLAEAAGAYVQADPLLDTLRILPRYPLLPWEWSAATPDITLPSAPVVREAIEWQDKAAYNRVFVSGAETGGILGQITRTGTAGDVVAPMVTDPLITHADAARARGRPILADTGRQARITLELPILPETGIITPGKLVQYTDAGTTRRGLVRSTAVTAQLPTARQTIELETHA